MNCTVPHALTQQPCGNPASKSVKLPNCRTIQYFCDPHFDAWQLQRAALGRQADSIQPVIGNVTPSPRVDLLSSIQPAPPPPEDDAPACSAPPPEDDEPSGPPAEPLKETVQRDQNGIRTDSVVVLDLETTGTNIVSDRIIQLCCAVYNLGDSPGWSVDPADCMMLLVNPGIPISPEASEVHGYTDDDVAGNPPFRQFAADLVNFIDGRYILTYNGNSFDIPMLAEELHRAGISWRPAGSIDALNLWKKAEPRKLVDAARRFAGIEDFEEDAHDAFNDVRATGEVMKGMMSQLECLQGLDLAGLSDFSKLDDTVDLKGCIIRKDGVYCYNIGERKGRPIHEDPGFAKWMLGKDFPFDTKQALRSILTEMGDFSWQR